VFTQSLRILTLVDISQRLKLSLTIFRFKQIKNLSILIYLKHLLANHLFNSHEVMSIIKLLSHGLNLCLQATFQR